MQSPPHSLRPATPDELQQALAHALTYDGRRLFRPSSEFMARVTAEHLAECLRRAGFVVMKAPPAPRHEAPPHPAD